MVNGCLTVLQRVCSFLYRTCPVNTAASYTLTFWSVTVLSCREPHPHDMSAALLAPALLPRLQGRRALRLRLRR